MLVTKPLIYNIDTNLWPGITSITLRARQTRSALRKKVKERNKVFRKQAWISSLTCYRVKEEKTLVLGIFATPWEANEGKAKYIQGT